MKTNFFGKIAVATSGLFLLATAHAAAPFYSPGGVAIKGYDPVAYFSDSKPVPGSDAYVTEWKGAKWKFASQEHLDKFKAEPEKYAPQYGGYCAFGTSQGHLAPTSPAAWTISDGKLYLNYNEQVQKKWSKDVAGYNKLADEQFDTLLKGPTE